MENKTIFEWAEMFQEQVQNGASESGIIQMLKEYESQALRIHAVSGAVALLNFLKEEQQKKYADAKDYMSANKHQYYEEGCDAVLQLIEMRFSN